MSKQDTDRIIKAIEAQTALILAALAAQNAQRTVYIQGTPQPSPVRPWFGVVPPPWAPTTTTINSTTTATIPTVISMRDARRALGYGDEPPEAVGVPA